VGDDTRFLGRGFACC